MAAGGLLIAVADWRLVFVINLPIGAAAYVLASRQLVESRATPVITPRIVARTIPTALTISVLVRPTTKAEISALRFSPRCL